MNKKMVFAALCYVFAISLFGCLPYQGGDNPSYTDGVALMETDGSYLSDEHNEDEIEESAQLDDHSLVIQPESDEDSFTDEPGYTDLREEHDVEVNGDATEADTEQIDWESFVNPTISYGDIDVVIERIDHSVYSEGYLVGDFFYEKPCLSGNSTAAFRISDYFRRGYDSFLNGSLMFPDNDTHQWIRDYLEESLGWHGVESIAFQPFTYNVVTKLTFLSDDYVSFFQTYRVWTTGPRDKWNFGVTFSMKTGEQVSFTEFKNISANEFKTDLCNTLMPFHWINSPEDTAAMYGPNSNNTFSATYYDIEIALDKSYFYDGHSVFLTLNYGLFPHSGFIIKWDDTMHVPCVVNYDDTIRMLDYP